MQKLENIPELAVTHPHLFLLSKRPTSPDSTTTPLSPVDPICFFLTPIPTPTPPPRRPPPVLPLDDDPVDEDYAPPSDKHDKLIENFPTFVSCCLKNDAVKVNDGGTIGFLCGLINSLAFSLSLPSPVFWTGFLTDFGDGLVGTLFPAGPRTDLASISVAMLSDLTFGGPDIYGLICLSFQDCLVKASNLQYWVLSSKQ